jgi:hypothetical protein
MLLMFTTAGTYNHAYIQTFELSIPPLHLMSQARCGLLRLRTEISAKHDLSLARISHKRR